MKARRIIATVLFVAFLIVACYAAARLPMQMVNIKAVTVSDHFDALGSVDILYLKSVPDSVECRITIQFMAVDDVSDKLFIQYGKGQYVNLGCSRLEIERDVMTFGKFLQIRLSMQADQSELKLEDGTPFDVTRYALRPVVTIEEKE